MKVDLNNWRQVQAWARQMRIDDKLAKERMLTEADWINNTVAEITPVYGNHKAQRIKQDLYRFLLLGRTKQYESLKQMITKTAIEAST